MTTRSRIASGVRTLCGDPPDVPLEADGLPEHTIYEVLTDVETQMLIDLNLSDQNRRVKSKTVSLQSGTGGDFALNASDFSMPSFAQLRLSPTDPYQVPVDIVNLSSVDSAAQEGRPAAAFYGSPTRVRLSWVPQGGDSHTLTLWYDRTVATDEPLAEDAQVEDAYAVHLKLQAVAQCMELMGKVVGPTLAARILKGERQWQKHAKNSGQQGLVSKPSSHPRARGRQYGRFQRPGGGFL